MDRDDFIIAVFLIVCEHYQAIQKHYRLRRGGFAPALTDEEVITMEICGEYFKLECDKDMFAYFHKHYLHFFPKLTDRSLFVRQAANLWQVKATIQNLDTLLEDFEGIAPADKGFIDEYRHSLLLERHRILVVTPPRKNMQTDLPKPLRRFCRRVRKFVETVGSHLTERFKIDQIRVHDLWHFQHRLIRKILAHTVCVFLNLRFHRPPLDLDGLVSA